MRSVVLRVDPRMLTFMRQDVDDSEVHRSTSASYGHADAYLDFPRNPRSDSAKKALDTI
jgi:hypothetical protein